jgi:ornithine lipid ester-linked acyl 2-hydroxylase
VPEAQALRGAGGKVRWKAWRRAKVKELGRRIIRLLDRLYGRQSLVPDTAIIPTEHFPFIAEVEENWGEILAELKVILGDRERIPFLNEVSPDQARISHSEKWRAFFLFGLGNEVTGNTVRCPKTAALLRKIPGLRSAWFSILAPNYRIKPHHGITKGIVRAHLGLIIPKEWHKCRMVVGETGVHWREGKCFIFDDSLRHRVTNATNEERVVLLFDFDRPMRWPSSALHRLAMRLLKRTAFFRDARRHFMNHEHSKATATNRDQTIVDAMQSIAD